MTLFIKYCARRQEGRRRARVESSVFPRVDVHGKRSARKYAACHCAGNSCEAIYIRRYSVYSGIDKTDNGRAVDIQNCIDGVNATEN